MVVVAAVGMRGESDTPAPDEVVPAALTPTLELSTTLPAGPTSEPEAEPAQEPADEAPAPTFSIEELTAECDAGEKFGVTALPLGADWRVTERGVYADSPVVITCVTAGANDALTYDWIADDGVIEGSGDSIVWTAPDHGAKIKVSVVVRDGNGLEEQAELNFRVATCKCVYQRYE
jgi:hypothetical protein